MLSDAITILLRCSEGPQFNVSAEITTVAYILHGTPAYLCFCAFSAARDNWLLK